MQSEAGEVLDNAPSLGRREVCERILHGIQVYFPQFVEETKEQAGVLAAPRPLGLGVPTAPTFQRPHTRARELRLN